MLPPPRGGAQDDAAIVVVPHGGVRSPRAPAAQGHRSSPRCRAHVASSTPLAPQLIRAFGVRLLGLGVAARTLAVTARIPDGKAIAAQIRSEVAERVRALAETGITPGPAAGPVGGRPAPRLFLGPKAKACADVGIRSEQVDL